MKHKTLLFSALFFFAPVFTFAFSGTPAPGTIDTDTVWTAEASPYIVSAATNLTVLPGVSLTLLPGTVVKFNQSNTSITVKGTLNVNGTADNPVYFTSLKDDAASGDTNGDGSATAPAPGEWSTINVSAGATANFTHAVLRYGGYFGTVISNSGTVTLSDSLIQESIRDGIVQGGMATISHTTFHKNIRYSIMALGTGTTTFSGSTFTGGGTPAYFNLKNGAIVHHAGNTASGNQINGFMVQMDGPNAKSQTWDADNIPYVITPLGAIVPAGKTLTIAAGAIIKPSQNNVPLEVNGALDILGTKENPVSFTAFADDSIGGDTDGDSPLWYTREWAGININPGGTAHIDHAILKRGGYWNAPVSNNGGTASITNSVITESLHYGIFSNGTTTATNNSIHDNASYGIYNNETEIVNAENNWWGSPTGPRHASNPGGAGQRVANFVDFTPWLGYDPTVGTPLTLGTPTETEDDGRQDAKGVADKTNFTFSVTAEGEPDSVNLFVNGAAIAFVKTGNTYTATSTFPKGHYAWHIEATKETETVSTAERHFTTGYSNVAFLPGLEASRLYRPEILSGRDEDQLWEPTRNQDVEELYLDPVTGESVGSNIYTRDVIGSAYGLTNIYSSFIEFMDGLKTDGTIHDWKELPYDWRFDYEKLLTSGKKTGQNISYLEATSTPFILQELRRLAEDSDTGKVTIITHSNGGLVAKYLLKKLELENDPLLPNIDKLIMVAAPQIGTPGAIEGLLHGDEQQIGVAISKTDFGMLMDEEHSRELGENMQSAYNLLPSQKYFETVQSPVIEFEPNDPITHTFSTLYGETVNTSDELRNFLLGDPQSGSPRTAPAPDDEESPNVLKPQFLDRATENHDTMIDDWTPPASMEVVQIAGWGIKTLSGVHYSCGLLTCSSLSTLDRDILQTHVGDGTVVIPSALYMSTSTPNVERFYVNVRNYNEEGFIGEARFNRDHSDILEVEPLRDFIKNIIKNTRTPESHITTTTPVLNEGDFTLDFRLHSPVALHLYDNEGTHTGRISNPVPGSDFRAYEARLPNSYYREYGETKYAGADTFATTTIRLVGEALGSFTFDIDETLGDTLVASTTWKDIPVTASSTLTLDIRTLASPAVLQMDVDGDGITDTALLPGDGVTSQELLAILKGVIKTFNFADEKEEKLLKRIEKIEKELEKEQKGETDEKQKTAHAFEKLMKTVEKFEEKRILTGEEAGELLEVVAQIKASVVK